MHNPIRALVKFRMEWCWFDVLCMPQGEKNQAEVNKEIPFMGDYYNGAKMTFVLSDSDEVREFGESGAIIRGRVSRKL